MGSEVIGSEPSKPKFKPGDKVKHPLGLECLVLASYDAQMNPETQEKVPLAEHIYQLQYLDNNKILQQTQMTESGLE